MTLDEAIQSLKNGHLTDADLESFTPLAQELNGSVNVRDFLGAIIGAIFDELTPEKQLCATILAKDLVRLQVRTFYSGVLAGQKMVSTTSRESVQ